MSKWFLSGERSTVDRALPSVSKLMVVMLCCMVHMVAVFHMYLQFVRLVSPVFLVHMSDCNLVTDLLT